MRVDEDEWRQINADEENEGVKVDGSWWRQMKHMKADDTRWKGTKTD